MNEPGQCRFMAAAYPMLNGYDTCQGFHRHEKATFDLAAALAAKYQDTPTPSMEQVAWFLNYAQSLLDDLGYDPSGKNVITAHIDAHTAHIEVCERGERVTYAHPVETLRRPAPRNPINSWIEALCRAAVADAACTHSRTGTPLRLVHHRKRQCLDCGELVEVAR